MIPGIKQCRRPHSFRPENYIMKLKQGKRARRPADALQTNIRKTNNSVQTWVILLLRLSPFTRDERKEKKKSQTAVVLEEK